MAFSNDIRFSFLYIDLYSMGRAWVYPESIIPYNMLRYIVKGEAEFCINDKTIKVKENQIVYIPKESRMSCRAISDVFKFFSLRFTTSVIYQVYYILVKVYRIQRKLIKAKILILNKYINGFIRNKELKNVLSEEI